MKRFIWAVLLMLWQCGCSAENTELERGLTFRESLLDASHFSFDADIIADYGDRVHQFTMQCETDAKGDLRFTVIHPESISGISGTIDHDGGKLTYDDAALYFSLLADDQLSPIAAPWILVKSLRGGYITTAGTDEYGVRLSISDCYEDEPLILDVWLDAQNIPHRAEITYNGYRILTLLLRNAAIL